MNGNRAYVELPSTTTRWMDVNEKIVVLESYMRLIYSVAEKIASYLNADLLKIESVNPYSRSDLNWNDKTVVPFATSMSSSLGQSDKVLHDVAGSNNGNWISGHRFGTRASDSEIRAWVDGLKF